MDNSLHIFNLISKIYYFSF